MNSITEQILHDVQELPADMQTEALDFIQFLKTKIENNTDIKQVSISNKRAIAELLEKASKENLFAEIDDPVTWQNEVRKDRTLAGRE